MGCYSSNSNSFQSTNYFDIKANSNLSNHKKTILSRLDAEEKRLDELILKQYAQLQEQTTRPNQITNKQAVVQSKGDLKFVVATAENCEQQGGGGGVPSPQKYPQDKDKASSSSQLIETLIFGIGHQQENPFYDDAEFNTKQIIEKRIKSLESRANYLLSFLSVDNKEIPAILQNPNNQIKIIEQRVADGEPNLGSPQGEQTTQKSASYPFRLKNNVVHLEAKEKRQPKGKHDADFREDNQWEGFFAKQPEQVVLRGERSGEKNRKDKSNLLEFEKITSMKEQLTVPKPGEAQQRKSSVKEKVDQSPEFEDPFYAILSKPTANTKTSKEKHNHK